MTFFLQRTWYCQFLEEDARTPLARKLNFRTPQKIIELAEHAGAFSTLDTRQAIEAAIENGRGGMWLELTEEQYRKLTRR